MLDRNGSPIQSPLNYTLEPVKASLPTTPMAMRGMYFYMADAATFTDCATGKRVAVANNARLERDYAAARGNDSRPVLLVVEGHFTLEANPDTGEMMKTLMTDERTENLSRGKTAGTDCPAPCPRTGQGRSSDGRQLADFRHCGTVILLLSAHHSV